MRRDFAIVLLLGVALTAGSEWFLATIDYPTVYADKGREIEDAFRVLTYFAAPVFSFVVAALVYTVLRRGSASPPAEDGPALRGRGAIPVGWLAVTAGLTLAIMVYPGLVGIPKIFDEEQPDLVVKVTGIQWAWLVDYPDYQISNADELVLPVDRTVRFDITSQDVIHSFWIPAFLMKIDAVPGRTTTMAVKPTRTGSFDADDGLRVQCAELCGIQHSLMRLPVRIVTQDEFNDWAASHAATATPQAATPLETPGPGGETATASTVTASNVTVNLSEFRIDLSSESLPAGPVTFDVANQGTVLHNLRIAATTTAADELSVSDATLMVDESQAQVVGSSQNLAAGESESLSVSLAPGSYVLFCNIPGHYQAGMHTSFTVE